jgi:hypothetical protein
MALRLAGELVFWGSKSTRISLNLTASASIATLHGLIHSASVFLPAGKPFSSFAVSGLFRLQTQRFESSSQYCMKQAMLRAEGCTSQPLQSVAAKVPWCWETGLQLQPQRSHGPTPVVGSSS